MSLDSVKSIPENKCADRIEVKATYKAPIFPKLNAEAMSKKEFWS